MFHRHNCRDDWFSHFYFHKILCLFCTVGLVMLNSDFVWRQTISNKNVKVRCWFIPTHNILWVWESSSRFSFVIALYSELPTFIGLDLHFVRAWSSYYTVLNSVWMSFHANLKGSKEWMFWDKSSYYTVAKQFWDKSSYYTVAKRRLH